MTWRPALRIARRTVRKSLSRSLLIAVLVGLPVAGATFVDVLVRTFSDQARSTYEQIGPADAELTVTSSPRLKHFAPTPYGGSGVGAGPSRDHRSPAAVDLASVLPQGSTWIAVPRVFELELNASSGHIIRPELVVADLSSPLAGHQGRLIQGTLPGSDGVVVTAPLAERLGLLDGDGHLVGGATVTVANGPTAQVTGIAQAPFCLDCEEILAAPSSSVAATVAGRDDFSGTPDQSYLVDLPSGVDANTLWRPLAAQGIALTPRDAYLHPERYGQTGSRFSLATPAALRAAALALLVTGLGLLEVVLLAGTAFAVGARRQVHDLGVIAATGATARQIRRIVLAQGLVLGVLGAAIGIGFGAAVALVGRPFWERLANGVTFGWNFGPWEIAVAAVVGAVSGVLAAVVPAIGAGRMTAVDALSGRFRVSVASKRRTPVIAGLFVASGVVTGVVGDHLMAADFASYVRLLRRASDTTGSVPPPSPTIPVGLVLLGAVLVVIGTVMLAPVVIGAIGRMARGLPLSGRLAVRDAARHRHRTGPATSAITVAVAGSVVFAFVLAGRAEANRISYVAYLPGHVLSVSGTHVHRDEHLVDTASAAAAAKLPNATVVRPRALTVGTGSRPRDTQEIFALPIRKQCRIDCSGLAVAAADPRVMALTLGRTPTPQELAAIAAGKVLVVSPRYIKSSGHVTFAVSGRSIRMPAVAADVAPLYRGLPGAFVSAAVVKAHGWGTIVPEIMVPFDRSASQTQIDDAKTAIEDRGAFATLDTGPSDPSRILLIIAGIAAAFVTLVGVAISVALSAAEGKADLATLAAVGAAPRRRRSLAAAQALLVGGLGCATGLLLGVFVSYTLRATIGAPGFVVPWRNLLVVGVVVPLVAMLIAAVFTPSRLPLTVRRSW